MPFLPDPTRPDDDLDSTISVARPVTRVDANSAQPGVRGGPALRALDGVMRAPTRWLAVALPDTANPLLQTGAVANTTFVIAVVTGILLLIWYVPSVHQAFDSVEAMAGAPWTAGLMRSLHRYSSDGCMLFAVVHGLQMLGGRKFAGARWLAWVTGIAMVSLLWVLGWTGYWLVWDQRGQLVAADTAKVIDVLPIFVDPLGRSLLTDASLSSLLFFLVFFLHMILPLPMGVGVWLHVTRLSRTPYFTGRHMTVWIVVTLVALALLAPAGSAARADLQAAPGAMTLDYWYLLPIALAGRMGTAALWAALLISGALLYSVPWSLRRRMPAAAVVHEPRCNACEACYHDCPYAAIKMAPRTDGRTDRPARAVVDPDRCVACGICNGSCETAGIGLPWMPELDHRRQLERWLDAADAPAFVAYVCTESAAGRLSVDPASGRSPDLPGYSVVPIPCAGWVLAHDVERAVRNGARGVLIAGCSSGACAYREGPQWTRARLFGDRKPALRRDIVSLDQVRWVQIDRGDTARLIEEAARFRRGAGAPAVRHGTGWRPRLAALPVAALLAALVYVPSDLPYAGAPHRDPQLVVSFKHSGQREERCRTLTADELSKLPAHMRRAEVCDRGRAPVRMRVRIDGAPVLEKSYAPGGLFGDEVSLAVERIPVTAGRHRVEVEVGDAMDQTVWNYRDDRAVEFTPGRSRVVLFDRASGFTVH